MTRPDGTSNVSIGGGNVGKDVGIVGDLNDSARLVLQTLRSDPSLTTKGLADSVGLTDRQVTRLLGLLRERGLIQRVGSTRAGVWIVPEQRQCTAIVAVENGYPGRGVVE